jgi:putative ABC transport system substrate-binding protein
MRADAAALGMQALIVEVAGKADFESALAAIRRAKTESILLPPEPLVRANGEAIAAFAQAQGVPLAVVGSSNTRPSTALFAYGPAPLEYAKLTAKYVDQILRGAKPGDLPIEQPTRFSLVINLKAARALGLTIPQSMLLLSDEVIE